MSQTGTRIGLSSTDALKVRRRLRIAGRVQGVGFRPCVYRLATGLGLVGIVGNDAHGAFVEVQGLLENVEAFVRDLPGALPAPGRIAGIDSVELEPNADVQFSIVESRDQAEHDAEIAPDLAVCDECLNELLDEHDRRHHYPLINCMHCGPRYSIIRDVPYDRPKTTMAGFIMCPACQTEYDNPLNRRFHAQPNACTVCGPQIWLLDRDRSEVEGDAIRMAARWLADGAVLAIKGIGGFHLVCCVDDDRAVTLLRSRKIRDAKPLAIMVPTLESAREFATIDQPAAEALLSTARPIVLVPKAERHGLSEELAPGTSCFGIMLPYTPIQHLLFTQGLGPLVMTSANASEEPLCYENEEALERLARIADGFLLHNRPIQRRVDDSVILSTGIAEAPLVPIRRSRGYVPQPIRLSKPVPEPILALGGDLKSTICIASGDQAVISEHFGDLGNPVAYRNYLSGIPHLSKLLHVTPTVVAHDLHPGYHSTRHAQWDAQRRIGVQHHHAHIVSCMAENGVTGPVVGIACDGTGYGTDGAIWGGEILICDEADSRRAAHLRYFKLPGGDAGASETWRPAVSLLRETFGRDWRDFLSRKGRDSLPEGVDLIDQRLSTARDIPLTSSLGRVFDAVAWLLGICRENRYEAEAAMALESVAAQCPSADPLSFEWIEEAGEPIALDLRPMVRELIDRAATGQSPAELALAFHEGIARMLVECAVRVSEREDLSRIALSGGCFANRILLERVMTGLRAAGRELIVHHVVPPGDGGLALGQAVVAAAKLRRS